MCTTRVTPALTSIGHTQAFCASSWAVAARRRRLYLRPKTPLLHHARPEVLNQDIRPV